MKTTHLLLAATALVAVAGCAKKRPAQLPPPPIAEPAEGAPVATGAPADGAIRPGSNEDFTRSVQSNTVNFGVDQYDIDPAARAILDGQVAWLQRYPRVRITIEGHCDERGTREYNLALGDRRANAAKNYLATRGIDTGRMTTISYGKERPLALGSDDASYAQNRRAVTVVLN
ncbi:peptidoglycan-associated lipoprotein Pal [Sphingomonas bacterium]|uniref:peptidoglycan-associated lipoprotein Pal n=1 Tax=Sphingomonas bacterium TaxID=1895847 RepID=UPI001575D7B6|nr:peptidoglycan-associated lipoprotein Pal [Sphingomonas bacterium]